MGNVTIYHNPQCSKSRQTLALLEDKDITLEVILYLETPPSRDTLQTLLTQLGFTARELIRTSEQEYVEMKLDNNDLTDSELIEAMVQVPKLIQRPIVVANGKARIGRPPESVLGVLTDERQ